jgi:hypothetical protein
LGDVVAGDDRGGNDLSELIKTRFPADAMRLANLSLAPPLNKSTTAGKRITIQLKIARTSREKFAGNHEQLSAFARVITTAVMT